MNTCRTCLKTPADKDISELEQTVDQDNMTCLDIILFCLDITISKDSKITTNLCNDCYRKIISFYKFKTLSLKSDAYLKSLDPLVQLVNVTLFTNKDEDGIKHENILDFDEFGPSLVEDLHTEIKYEMDYQNEDALDVESDKEPLNEVEEVKYECIEEEILENALTQKKHMPRKKECDPRKEENAPKKKKCGPSLNENGAQKKRRGPKKAKSENTKQERHICEECGEAVVNLKEHSVRHQPKEQREMLQCKACPKQFLSIGGRNKHYRISHLGKKQTCDVCNKKVACLSVHRKVVHNRHAMQYGCVLCERRYVSQSALDFHMTRHTEMRQYECDACRMRFRSKTRLSRHIRRVHDKEKKYQCHICPKAFFQKWRLQVHIKSHTNERPFKCEECGKAFTEHKTLKNHQATHSGEKNYSCSVCDMTFLRPGYLKTHMISHTKEKRHPCQYCGARFGRSDHRRRHEFTAHQKHLASD